MIYDDKKLRMIYNSFIRFYLHLDKEIINKYTYQQLTDRKLRIYFYSGIPFYKQCIAAIRKDFTEEYITIEEVSKTHIKNFPYYMCELIIKEDADLDVILGILKINNKFSAL